MFDGSLLHGVLPGRGADSNANTPTNNDVAERTRLTLMVGFWSIDISQRIKQQGGGRGALMVPRNTKTRTWPRDLCSHKEQQDEQNINNTRTTPVTANAALVRCCEPAWENIAIATGASKESVLTIPSSIQQRFWVADAHAFRRALLNVESR